MKHLPNILTSLNLVCGLLALEAVIGQNFETAFWFMVAAAVFDFFDGFAARLLNTSSDFGKELDSLADLITFGVVPGMVVYYMMINHGFCPREGFCTRRYAFILIPLFSALRLARFNTSGGSTSHFTGVPTPINGLMLASLPMAFTAGGVLQQVIESEYFFVVLPVLSAFLMVSDLPMLAFKLSGKGISTFIPHLLFLAGAVALIIIWGIPALLPVYLWYLLLSLIFLSFKSNPKATEDSGSEI